ncbi:PepSY-like domain-containing protein [Changchengzhania lutea]|uniref:PepSY-like domain-containing protein n=1 Tax=Changchengzhania lutea TaxID=2049305 RepID=UPI001FE74AD3|nr:PepSY-like domain-containing protein [Changchengzhania lutea]
MAGILLSFIACDKDASTPQKVKDAFTTRFPNATDVEWEKESDTEWEAEFKLDGKEHTSNFMQNGTWVETEYEVAESEVPQVVMDPLNANFEGYNIEDMELSETATGTVYEFEIEKGEDEMEVVINSSGKVVKQEVIKGDGKEDND